MKHFDKFDAESLAQIKARGIPRLRWWNLFQVSGVATAEAERRLELVDAYAQKFANPDDRRCVCCGHPITGWLSTFRYDLVHGEGVCSICGYPARAIHHIHDDVGTIRSLVLQYHPDGLDYAPILGKKVS